MVESDQIGESRRRTLRRRSRNNSPGYQDAMKRLHAHCRDDMKPRSIAGIDVPRLCRRGERYVMARWQDQCGSASQEDRK